MKTLPIVISLLLLGLACTAQGLKTDDASFVVVYIPSAYPKAMRVDSNPSLYYFNGYHTTALLVMKEDDILGSDGLQFPEVEKYSSDKYLIKYNRLPEPHLTPETKIYSGNMTYYPEPLEPQGNLVFSTYNKQRGSTGGTYVIEKIKVVPAVQNVKK